MKSSPSLHCPHGCGTVEQDFKLVECYGPHRTPLYRCLKCRQRFSSRHASVFVGFHTDDATIYRVLKALAEGTGMRATARIFDLHKDTVAGILEQAARHCQQVTERLIANYHLDECQLDELWSFVKKRKRAFQHLRSWPPSMGTSGCGSGLIRVTRSSCTLSSDGGSRPMPSNL